MALDHVYSSHFATVQRWFHNLQRKYHVQPAELAVLAIYPFTVLLGQLLHITNSNAEVSYYNNKRNIVNQLFVKKGWFWSVSVMAYFLIRNHQRINLRSFAVRVSASTLWWYFFTQWCFGLPIMDRIFMWTGGACQYDSRAVRSQVQGNIGSLVCRKLSGQWIGGHDPSGHVFLLVHSSIMIWFELIEAGLLEYEFRKLRDDFKKVEEAHGLKTKTLLVVKSSSFAIMALLALWWWMLLITSTHFHSFAEKLTGLIAGNGALVVYLLPRYV